MTFDSMVLDSADITTVDSIWKKWRFEYAHPRVSIVNADYGTVLTASVVSVTKPSDLAWVFALDDGTEWAVVRSGCRCGGVQSVMMRS